MNEEVESPLHHRWGGSLELRAEGWRLGTGAGIGISEATGTGIATMGQSWKSWKSLGYAKPRLGRLGMLGMLGKRLGNQPKSEEAERKRTSTMTKKKKKKEDRKGYPVISFPGTITRCTLGLGHAETRLMK